MLRILFDTSAQAEERGDQCELALVEFDFKTMAVLERLVHLVASTMTGVESGHQLYESHFWNSPARFYAISQYVQDQLEETNQWVELTDKGFVVVGDLFSFDTPERGTECGQIVLRTGVPPALGIDIEFTCMPKHVSQTIETRPISWRTLCELLNKEPS